MREVRRVASSTCAEGGGRGGVEEGRRDVDVDADADADAGAGVDAGSAGGM